MKDKNDANRGETGWRLASEEQSGGFECVTVERVSDDGLQRIAYRFWLRTDHGMLLVLDWYERSGRASKRHCFRVGNYWTRTGDKRNPACLRERPVVPDEVAEVAIEGMRARIHVSPESPVVSQGDDQP